MALFALRYEIVPDYFEARGPHKEPHVAYLDAAFAAGTVVSAGVFGMPPVTADYVFSVEDRAAVEAFAAADPYVTGGLVTRWTVEPWHVIAGPA